MLPGGAETFRRRRFDLFGKHSNHLDIPEASPPVYPGLACGRFCGRKSKLHSAMTDDLQFSFKCIIGALVLALGTDNAWFCLRPLFEEVLVLAPNELREKYKYDLQPRNEVTSKP